MPSEAARRSRSRTSWSARGIVVSLNFAAGMSDYRVVLDLLAQLGNPFVERRHVHRFGPKFIVVNLLGQPLFGTDQMHQRPVHAPAFVLEQFDLGLDGR